jgi:hypothetical protein
MYLHIVILAVPTSSPIFSHVLLVDSPRGGGKGETQPPGTMFAPYACMAHTPKLANGFRNLAQFLAPQTRAAPETKIPDSPTTSLLAAGGEERIANSTAWILTGQRRVCASVDGYRSRSSPSQVTVVQ